MMKVVLFSVWVLGFFLLAGAPVLHAEPELKEAVGTEEEAYSDPSSVTAELDSPSGERAPEVLPMEDSPGDAGIAVD